jgi:hypothetical protein
LAVDASLIVADAYKQRSISGQEWDKDRDPTATRAGAPNGEPSLAWELHARQSVN